jgi:hypothetical protein
MLGVNTVALVFGVLRNRAASQIARAIENGTLSRPLLEKVVRQRKMLAATHTFTKSANSHWTPKGRHVRYIAVCLLLLLVLVWQDRGGRRCKQRKALGQELWGGAASGQEEPPDMGAEDTTDGTDGTDGTYPACRNHELVLSALCTVLTISVLLACCLRVKRCFDWSCSDNSLQLKIDVVSLLAEVKQGNELQTQLEELEEANQEMQATLVKAEAAARETREAREAREAREWAKSTRPYARPEQRQAGSAAKTTRKKSKGFKPETKAKIRTAAALSKSLREGDGATGESGEAEGGKGKGGGKKGKGKGKGKGGKGMDGKGKGKGDAAGGGTSTTQQEEGQAGSAAKTTRKKSKGFKPETKAKIRTAAALSKSLREGDATGNSTSAAQQEKELASKRGPPPRASHMPIMPTSSPPTISSTEKKPSPSQKKPSPSQARPASPSKPSNPKPRRAADTDAHSDDESDDTSDDGSCDKLEIEIDDYLLEDE